MRKQLSKPQLDYKEARDRFEKANKEFEQKLAATKLLGNVSQQTMENLVEQTDLHNALNELGQAERALLKWSHEMIKNEKDYLKNKEAVDRMYSYIEQNPTIKAQLIQAAMQME